MIDNFKFFHLENIFQKYCTYSHIKIIRLQKPTIHQKSNSNPDVKPIREIWKSKSRNLVTGKCTSAEVGGRNTEDCFAFLASIKDHRDCGTTYGHLLSTGAPLARTHTRTHVLSRSRFNAVSFFNCDSSSLETHPSCRATWIGTSPHLLSPPRHPSSTSHLLSLFLSLSRCRSRCCSLSLSLSFSLSLSLSLLFSLSLSLSRHTDTK